MSVPAGLSFVTIGVRPRIGYVADPEGNRWEIAWAPGIEGSP